MKPIERFTGRADAYAAGRPSYPGAALDVIFQGLREPNRLTAVDLGAGTGISSGLLAARGATTIAVEPNAAMRDRALPMPNLQWKIGTAEETGLATASADLVTAFQAFHWFEHAAAVREIARLLRPGGRAAIVYNERDEDDAFTAAYGALARRFATDRTEQRRSAGRAAISALRADPAWTTVRVAEVRHAHVLDGAGLHARARSTSYLPMEGSAGAALHTAIDALFEQYADGAAVTMRLKTIVSLADRFVR